MSDVVHAVGSTASAGTTTNSVAAGVVLFAGILCGTTGTALARLAPSASPLSAGAARLLVGGLTLSAVTVATGHTLSELRGHRRWLVAGAVAVALYQLCFFTGTTRTGVALATVVALGSAPVFSGLLHWVIDRRRPTGRWASGTLLAMVGVALITSSQPSSRTDIVGVGAALTAGLGWATYAMIGQQRIRRGLDPTVCMASMFTAAAALSAPLLGVGNIGWLTTGNGIALGLFLGVVTVGIVYSCIGWGLRRLAAPTVLTLTLAVPMAASSFAALVLHQAPGAVGWIGTAVVLVALLLTATARTTPALVPSRRF
jgi:DME family drug/metabolite transporter